MLLGLLTILSSFHLFGSTVQTYICQPPATPVITLPVDNSSAYAGPVKISGTATAGSTVIITSNNTSALQLTADNDNNFSGDVTFGSGNYSLLVDSNSPCGDKAGDTTVHLHVSPQPQPAPTQTTTTPDSTTPLPILLNKQPTITSDTGESSATAPGGTTPAYTSTGGLILRLYRYAYATTAASTTVSGYTNLPTAVNISSGGSVIASANVAATSFSLNVPLQVGENTFTITAATSVGTATSIITITRTAPATTTPAAPAHHWYKTTPGKIAIVATGSGILIALLWLSIVFLL